jgi:dTDP-4-amino-4,6-dideoxygalactose transaminase
MKKKISRVNITKTDLVPYLEYEQYLKKIWKTQWVTNNGKLLIKFEKKLQKLFGTENLLVVSNGTLALQLALKALPQRSGEIITTPFTFQATTNAIVWEGFTPIFADIDPETFNININEVEKKITRKTVAILAVHVYGNACNVERLKYIARKHNIMLIFDAAHAFDVVYKGKQLATYGDISILSFHATKTFHTIEGGAVISSNPKLIEELKLLRNFGIKSEEEVISCGINMKMNEFQAAMGLVNLRWLDRRYKDRKKVYNAYLKDLSNMSGVKLQKIVVAKMNYTYLPILLPSKELRDKIYEEMKRRGIGTRKYFYPLTSSAKYLQNSKYGIVDLNLLPVAKNISDRVLCLPLYASLSLFKVKEITSFLAKLLST